MNIFETGICKELTPQELLDEVMIDFCYFVATGGGITFGGAEPLLQIEAILEFMDLLPEYVFTNIETSLNVDVPFEVFKQLANKVENFIIDIKTTDSDLYLEYTGITNHLTMRNLNWLAELGLQNKCKLRIPIIPNYKDESTAQKEAAELKDMGFTNLEIFPYIIRDYMK